MARNKTLVACLACVLCIYLMLVPGVSSVRRHRSSKSEHKFRTLSPAKLTEIATGGAAGGADPSLDRIRADVDAIAVVRVPDSPAIVAVRNHIIACFEDLGGGWSVETDTFTDSTPHGPKSFTNVIATYGGSGGSTGKRLIVAAHYDSKTFDEFEFTAATDSAVPVALMLEAARDLTPKLEALQRKPNTALQFVFFDGEEAYDRWTATDSLYGSRHLAAKWESEEALGGIKALVLLDLIGASEPRFYGHWENTRYMVERFADIESRLRKSSVIRPDAGPFFVVGRRGGGVQDDHIPFLKRGVPIVHLIASPFPPQWHKESDTVANLDWDAIRDFDVILRAFLAEYYHTI